MSDDRLIAAGRRVLRLEAEAIASAEKALGSGFARAVELLRECTGRVIVTGVGKSGLIARKIAATLTSTGTPATWLHPVDSLHGDLGLIGPRDVAIVLSKSGETEELVALLGELARLQTPIIALTGGLDSTLARAAAVVLDAGVGEEACPHDLAPTASTTVALALGDALAVALLEEKGFARDDFARLHPGGRLGRKLLLRVSDVMQAPGALLAPTATMRDAVVELAHRRGLAMVGSGGTPARGGDRRRSVPAGGGASGFSRAGGGGCDDHESQDLRTGRPRRGGGGTHGAARHHGDAGGGRGGTGGGRGAPARSDAGGGGMTAQRRKDAKTQGGRHARTWRPCVLASLRLSLAAALLAGCFPKEGVRPVTESVAADSADQVLFKMSTKITNAGVLRSHVDADTAFIYQRSQTMDLRHFTALLLDEKGNLKSTLTADRGLYVTYSNKLDARGHVVATTVDGQKIQTEHLIYDKQANQITIDTTFVYDSKKGHLVGNCMKSDIDFTMVDVCQPKGHQKGKGSCSRANDAGRSSAVLALAGLCLGADRSPRRTSAACSWSSTSPGRAC